MPARADIPAVLPSGIFRRTELYDRNNNDDRRSVHIHAPFASEAKGEGYGLEERKAGSAGNGDEKECESV